MMKKFKSQRAVTIMSLVVTVIVLLIIAAITINLVISQNSVIKRTKIGKVKMDETSEREYVNVSVSSLNSDLNDGFSAKELEDEINATMGTNGVLVEEIGENRYRVVFNDTKNAYEVINTTEETKVFAIGATENVESSKLPLIDEAGDWNIYNLDQLKFFADFVNNKLTDEQKNGMTIKNDTVINLKADIDVGARFDANGNLTSGTKWTPIALGDDADFNATFNGNNHIISGVYVKESAEYVGFFSGTEGTMTIKNLTIKDSYFEGDAAVGAIAGVIWQSGIVENCHNVNSTVVGKNYDIGGIVGDFAGNISNCTNNGTIKCEKGDDGLSLVAGIVGSAGGGINIYNCTNDGLISGTGDCVGGVVGGVPGDGHVVNCVNNGEVNCLTSHVGGIVGYVEDTTVIKKCTNNGNVYLDKDKVATGVDHRTIGGIAGCIYFNGTIEDCTNTGNVTGDEFTGGITGSTHGSDITGCTNSGKILSEKSNGFYVGGITGLMVDDEKGEKHLTNCSNSGRIQAHETVGGLVGLSSGVVSFANCSNIGGVYANGADCGGLAGFFGNKVQNVTVDNCYNTGEVWSSNAGGLFGGLGAATITNSYNTGHVKGNYAGGLIGQTSSKVVFKISHCYNTGNVESFSTNYNIGGIVGRVSTSGASGRFEYLYNSGKISKGYPGGILGAHYSQFVVTKCYSKGEIEGDTVKGAIFGVHNGNNLSNVTSTYYYDRGLKGVSNMADTDGLKATTDDIDSYDVFLSWIEDK